MWRRLFKFIQLIAVTSILVTGCAVLSTPGILPDGASSVEVPSEFHGDYIFVEGNIGNGDPIWLLLDTGFTSTLLNPDIANGLEVELTSGAMLIGAGEEAQEGRLPDRELAVSLTGTPSYLTRVPVVDMTAIEPYIGRRFDGGVGGDFFSRYVVEIDYHQERVIVHDPGRFRPDPEAERIPLTIMNNQPHVEAGIVLPDDQIIRHYFMLDTGSDGSLILYEPFVRNHAILERIPDAVPHRFGGIGGEVESRLIQIESIDVGPYRMHNIPTVLSLAESGLTTQDHSAGHLGTNILSRFRITFDYHSGMVYLTLQDEGDRVFPRASAGFNVKADGPDLNQFVVYYVIEDTPAEQSGLQTGDRLIRVNGQSADQYSLPEIDRMIRGEPGEQLELEVERNGRTKTFVMDLEIRI